MTEPLSKRRQLLRDSFSEVEGEFVFAKSMNSTDTDEIAEFLDESIKGQFVDLHKINYFCAVTNVVVSVAFDVHA